jgi:hypothetical protein
MLRRLTLILTLISVVGLLTAPAVAAARPGSGVGSTVSGTFTGATEEFVGDITVNSVTAQGGDLVASGTIVGQLTDIATGAVTQVNDTFTAVVDVANATCDILSLVLGPLHLDLLGLVVDLNQVVLNVTAEQGPGNLLGNLLCAVAGLLDGGLNLNGIANLLNQILSILA